MIRPLIVAHRGDASHAPENTMAAFESAIQTGAAGIELDVQESADGEVFVFHDMYLGRTVAGHELFGKLTSQQVQCLDAGMSYSTRFIGTKIPLLNEVLEKWHDKIRFEIELKAPSCSLAKKVVQAVRNFRIESSTEITSGHLPLLGWLREWHREIELGTWFNSAPEWMQPTDHVVQITAYADLLGLDVIHLPAQAITKQTVESIHETRRLVHGANLNDERLCCTKPSTEKAF